MSTLNPDLWCGPELPQPPIQECIDAEYARNTHMILFGFGLLCVLPLIFGADHLVSRCSK